MNLTVPHKEARLSQVEANLFARGCVSQAERGGTPLSHRQKLPTHNTQNRKVDDEMDHDISKINLR